jgi:hypothetical protein
MREKEADQEHQQELAHKRREQLHKEDLLQAQIAALQHELDTSKTDRKKVEAKELERQQVQIQSRVEMGRVRQVDILARAAPRRGKTAVAAKKLDKP